MWCGSFGTRAQYLVSASVKSRQFRAFQEIASGTPEFYCTLYTIMEDSLSHLTVFCCILLKYPSIFLAVCCSPAKKMTLNRISGKNNLTQNTSSI